MIKSESVKKFFKNNLTQSILLFILLLFLAVIFLNMPLGEIGKKLPDHVDAYLVAWIWSWDVHALTTHPLNLFQANIFAPFKNTLAFSETMLGTALLAAPFILIFNNIFLAYNIVVLLSFAISGLGMYLLVLYLTKNRWAGLIAAFIYAFAPFKLIHSTGHLHLTGMWLPFVFLFLHKFFKNQSWKNAFYLTFFTILVFLTGFHYFIFLPIVLFIFFLFHFASKNFRFNKNNLKKIFLCLILFSIIAVPIIVPYVQVKNDYGLRRGIPEIEASSPDLVDYLVPPFFYNYFYHYGDVEMATCPGIIIIILLIISLVILIRSKFFFSNIRNVRIFLIYGLVALIAFLISFGFYIQFTRSDTAGMIGLYALFYYLLPGFNGLRALGRYSVFVLLSISVFIGYGIYLGQKFIQDLFKKILLLFLIISFLFLELSFVPLIPYSYTVRQTPNDQQLYNWLKKQPSDMIFLEMPFFLKKIVSNHEDALFSQGAFYPFNSRHHFRKIVNGYSGYYLASYLKLAASLNSQGLEKSLPLVQHFQVDYVIFHFGYYQNPENDKLRIIEQLAHNENFEYIANFGNNYIYKINYD